MKYAEQKGFNSAIVRTVDTDIFFILLHHVASFGLEIFLDTGSGKQSRLINVSEIARENGADYFTTLLGIYVFTGENATSAFKGNGKISPLKKLNANPFYHSVFKSIGEEWAVSNDI